MCAHWEKIHCHFCKKEVWCWCGVHSLRHTHIVGGECMRISPPAGLCTGAWCFAMGLVLCAGAWCKPLHQRFFHLRPINAPKQIACLCETFLGIIKLLWRSFHKERILTLLVIVNSIIIDHNQHQHIMIIPTWAAPLLLHIFERKARPRPGIRISFKRFTSNHLQMLLLLAYLFHFIAPITKYVVLLIGTQLPSWSSHWYEPKYQEKISFLVLTLSILESPSSRSHTALHCHYLCDCSL